MEEEGKSKVDEKDIEALTKKWRLQAVQFRKDNQFDKELDFWNQALDYPLHPPSLLLKRVAYCGRVECLLLQLLTSKDNLEPLLNEALLGLSLIPNIDILAFQVTHSHYRAVQQDCFCDAVEKKYWDYKRTWLSLEDKSWATACSLAFFALEFAIRQRKLKWNIEVLSYEEYIQNSFSAALRFLLAKELERYPSVKHLLEFNPPPQISGANILGIPWLFRWRNVLPFAQEKAAEWHIIEKDC